MGAKEKHRLWAEFLVVGIICSGCTTLPDESPVCSVLDQVAAQVRAGETTSLRLFLGPFDTQSLYPITCQHNGDARWRQVCPTLLENTSHEFSGVFAQQVKGCLIAHGRIDRVEVGDEKEPLAGSPPRLVEVDGRLGRTVLRMRELSDVPGYEVALSR